MGEQVEKLAQFVAGTPLTAVPIEVQRYAKLVALDTIGVILAGADRPEVRALRERLVATAGSGARLELGFLAQDVYLVLGGSGTINVSINGHHTQTIDVSGIPRLYTLYQAASANTGTLQLQVSPGVQAYDFTFG